jgi:hypothetical protein
MVISHQYRYLFIELFRTGSTAISKELCEMYDGQKILSKHSRYHEFINQASKDEKSYFVFSGIRHPMDTVVSGYTKLLHNHKGRYTDPTQWRKNGGLITEKNLSIYRDIHENKLSFENYFRKYYKLPYDNWASVAHSKLQHIIRFEHIQEDFSEALKKLGIPQKRSLPLINKTEGKTNYLDYYTPSIRDRAVYIFGPFMEQWGYDFPASWGVKKVSTSSKLVFRTAGFLKHTYWKFSKTNSVAAE